MAIDPALHPIWARLENGRYRRNFAGRDRATRDLHLLDEMIEGLRARVPHLQGSDAERANNDIELFTNERPKIVEAQQSGPDTDRSLKLGTRANNQFQLYNNVFAGKPRVSRSPALLARITASLETILSEMRALKEGGLLSASNDRNIGIVEERLEMYRRELDQVKKAQSDAGANLRGQLGTAANEIFRAYRDEFQGKNRQEADPDRLHALIEQLHPVAREMEALQERAADDVNADNLRKVLDHLGLYENEFQLIVQAKISGR